MASLQFTVYRQVQVATAREGQFAIGRAHAQDGLVVHHDVQIAARGHQRPGCHLDEVQMGCLRLEIRVKTLALGLEGLHRHLVRALETVGCNIGHVIGQVLTGQSHFSDGGRCIKG
jgi:hypothetical protein